MSFFRAILCLFAALALHAQEAPPPAAPAKTTGSVEGKAVNSATGQPVHRVSVFLQTKAGARGTSYVAETDSNGRFSIDDVEPGEYGLNADRSGFALKPPGATGAPLPPVKVEIGQAVKDVTITLIPLGVITGHISDEDGDPVRGAQVTAMQYGAVQGKQQLRNISQVAANDKGDFRLFGLRPGTFYLMASSRNQQAMMGIMPGENIRGNRPPSGYTPTYYPSTSESARAVPIELPAGAQLRGMDIRLRREALYRVHGKFPGLNNGGFGGFALQLVPFDGSRMGRSFATRWTNDAFEFPAVRPGSYVITGMRTEDGKRVYVSHPVEVGSEDVDVGALIFAPGFEINGTVRVEGGKRNLEDLRLNLNPQVQAMGNLPGAKVNADGSFAFHEVAADIYLLNINTGPGSYLKAIHVGDRESPDQRIDLSHGAAQITVVLSMDVGQVEGSVKKADGDPAVRVRVTLVPEGDRYGRQDLSRFAFTSEKGEYTIKSVPPGDYKVFAWEDVQQGLPQDPEWRKPFEKRGIAIKVPPSGHATAEPGLITVAQIQHPEQ